MTTEHQTMPKQPRAERTKQILENPETMQTIFAHITNGGSMIDLCHTWDVRYCDIVCWVLSDKNRKIRYNQAILARTEWFVRPMITLIGIFNDYELFTQKMNRFHHGYAPSHARSEKDRSNSTENEI